MDIEILKNIYWVIVYLNIPLIFLSLFLATTLLIRRNNPVYLTFGTTLLLLSFWLLRVFLSFSGILPLDALYMNLSYFLATWIVCSFLIFTYKYPFDIYNKKGFYVFLVTVSFFVSLSFFISGFNAIDISGKLPFVYAEMNPVGIVFFSLYFFIYMSLAIKNLAIKYFRIGGVYQSQIKKLLIFSIIAFFVNYFLSNTIYLFTNFSTVPIGALFTAGVLYYIYYVIFKS